MNWKKALLFVGLPVIVALMALDIFAQYDADFLWFQNLGFASVFTTILWAKVLIFTAFFFIFALAGGANVYIARKVGAKSRFAKPANFKSPAAIFDSLLRDKLVLCIWVSLLLFITVLWPKFLIGISILFIFAVMGAGYIYLAKKSQANLRSIQTNAAESLDYSADIPLFEKYLAYGWILVILLLSGFMGMRASDAWLNFLKFMHQSQFSVADPVFSKDAGFYVYSLPVYYFLKQWCFIALLLIIGVVGFSYYFDQAIGVHKKRFHINFGPKVHLSVLGGLTALIVAWSYRLKIYSLIHSNSGVIHGAGYTDIHAQIPAYWLITILCLCMAFIFFAMPVLKELRWVAYFIGLFFVLFIGSTWIYPSLMERYVVKPDELSKETPYIKNNIRFTRLGFNFDKVRERLFPIKENMSYSDIKNNESTIQNIRLWDHRPLFQTYKQLQEIRLYYNFSKVDMDRYQLQDKYTEMAISSRGLSVGKLPGGAATWVNAHLVYTHGYGVVMSPVNELTSDGMPKFTVKDIPPQSNSPIAISRPEIYYGESGSSFAIVHTANKEFDYPKGGKNVYTTYRGNGGVLLSSFFRRLIFSLRLSDLNILLSGSITDQSHIMFNRLVQKRDRIIAPFLSYDSDPYIVVGEDGHLYWIHDAYTTTNIFPYSQPLSREQDPNRSNYIRNSVKVVIDAYNGDVSYYLIDPSDPLAQTYKKMFPALFTPAKEMPAFLKTHLRYPKDMFIKQIQMFTAYHMTDPQVFYNQEDLWSLPQQIYSGKKQAMLPYYIIMKLPDLKTEEFILMLPMTPSNKDNMIAWICARCDGDNYGQLLTYNLPKGKLIYGPRQIEARINQQPSITSEMTLWGQFGSRVIRGNLLTIPIANSFMYIEPVYLQSKEGEIPQLKRVIAIQNGELKMEKNLNAALKAGFAEAAASQVKPQKGSSGPNAHPMPAMAREALNHYHKAQEYLNQAIWSKYWNELDQIQRILQAMTTGNKP